MGGLPWVEAIGEANLAIEFARDGESCPGDLPRETFLSGALGTGQGLDGDESCLEPDIEAVVG